MLPLRPHEIRMSLFSSSGLEKCLSNGCSAVNGCRQNESLIKTSQHSSPSVNIWSWNKSSIKMILTKIRLQWKVHLLSSLTSKSSHLLVCSCFDLCRFLSWFRPEHFITGGRVIMGYFSCLYAVRIWCKKKSRFIHSLEMWKVYKSAVTMWM